MDRDKLIQRLRATFSSELREHVEAFNRELLSLERGGTEASRADSIKTLFRTAHSLKGAARAVSASKLEQVCHNLEELLQGLRDGSRQLTPEIFETLFAAVDTFEEAGREISASLPPSDNPPRPRPTPHPASGKPVAARGPAPAPAAPPREATPRTTPPASAPSGSAPSGSAPSGSAPSGSAPSGSALSGTAPSGSAPSGSALSGTAPSGTAPSGTAPSATAPHGTAPHGTAPSATAPHAAAPHGTAPHGTAPSGTAPHAAAPPTAAAPAGGTAPPTSPPGAAAAQAQAQATTPPTASLDESSSSRTQPPDAAARAAASAFESVRPTRPAEGAPAMRPASKTDPGPGPATAKPAMPAPDRMTVPPGRAPSDAPPARSSSNMPPVASGTKVPALGAPPHVSTLPPQSLQSGFGNESSVTSIAHETFLRVPEHKLDSLLAASSELLIARRRIDARHSQLHALCDRVAELRASWERTARSSGPAARGGVRQPGNLATRIDRHAAHAIESDRDQLANIERALEGYSSALTDDMRALDRAADALDERIHQVRMLPFVQACDALHRSVRDLASRERKPTELVIRGGEIELDRSIVDGLRAPLLHLVRNAIDHGIENADERSSSSKPPRATLTIAAALRGDRVEVSVRDDGRGIDLERIRERIRLNGLPAPVDDQDALRMIFEAGFSTAPAVTDVSGRGVGLDVVRTQIEAMRGSVTVSFESGRYTCFTLALPLTVTTLRALLMRSGSEVFALPSTAVEKLVRASADELAQLQGRESLLRDGAPLPLVSLAEIIGAEAAPPSAAQSKLPVVILSQPGERVALAVDELIAEQDVVIKPLGRRIRKLRHVSGATLLPSGRIALLLHAGEVLRTALGRVPARRAGGMFQPSLAPVRKRLLLVDDSATTRTLEKSILEAAGYEVATAVDGAQAWELLKEHGADLIVSDVEMPNLSGFELTQTIRSSKRFRETPVILLTSLDSEQDRARGLESGADAYLVKSAFDQTNLLETIRQLL